MNEFKIKKGLIVNGSGTVLDIQGTQGQLFSVTDSLIGSLFSVNNISGIPIMEVFSDDTIKLGSFGAEAIIVSGSTANIIGTLTGNSTTSTTLQTARTLTIGNTGKTFNGGANVSWSLAEIGAQGILTNPVTGIGTTNYLPKFTGTSTLGNSSVFESGGNVGIGTNTPNTLLDIQGSLFPFLLITSTSGIPVSSHYGVNSALQLAIFGTVSNHPLAFRTNAIEFMRATISGDVGIQTTTPTNTLDVNGTVRIRSIANATGDFLTRSATGVVTARTAAEVRTDIGGIGGSGTAGQVSFWTGAGVQSGDSGLFWDNVNKRLGIGIATPTDGKLQVGGNTQLGNTIVQTYFGVAAAAFKVTDNGSWVVGLDAADGSTERLRITSAGNLGIGTSSPVYKLDVSTALTGTAAGDNTAIALNSQASGRDANIRFGDSVNATARIGYLSGALYMYTNGAERMRIDSAGNVGIGTSSPSTKLDVSGSVTSQADTAYYRIRRASAADVGYVTDSGTWGDSGTDFAIGASSSNLRFYTNNSPAERMRITSTGNVGIGTIAPSEKLHVSGNILVGTRSNATGNFATYSATGVFQERTAAQTLTDIGGIGGSGTTNFLPKFTASGTIGNSAVFESGGNVGIGTSSPQSIFHIGASALANAGEKAYTGLAATAEGFLFDYYYDTTASNLRLFDVVPLGFATTGIGGSALRFFTVPQTTTNTPLERMRITSAGNVGIGTTAPSAKLQVSQDITSYSDNIGQLILSGNNATKRLYMGYNTSTDKSFIQSTKTDDTYKDLLLNPLGGNVGIGTTAPDFKLDVNGGARFSGSALATGFYTPGFFVPISARAVFNNDNYTGPSVDSASFLTGNGATGVIMGGDSGTYTYGWIQGVQSDSTKSIKNISINPLGGTVGIGTTAPSNTLDVNGTARIRTRSNATGNFATYSATGVLQERTAAEVVTDLNVVTIATTQTITGAKTFTSAITHNSTATRDKYRVWSSSEYTIGMTTPFTFGAINNDYAMTFQMNNANSRGFWWGDSVHTNAQGAMALSTNGFLTVASGIRVGYGEGDTTVPTLPLDISGNAKIAGTLQFSNGTTSTGIYQSSTGRLQIIANSVDSVAEFTVYGMFLNRGDQAYNLYANSGIAIGYNNNFPLIQYGNGASAPSLEFRSGTGVATMKLSQLGVLEVAGQIHSPVNAKGNSGTAVTFNWNDANIQTVTMTGNATFTFSNPQSGASYQIIITQDATGGRTITWPTIHWEGKAVPSLTGTANSVDVVTLTYDGAKYLGVMAKNFGTP